jgi:alcohol dehydrogenase (cytochrome c)
VVDSTKLTGASTGGGKYICPSLEGGKTPVAPAAFSPRTGLFYLSTVNLCMDYTTENTSRLRGTPYIGASTPYQAGPGGHLGAFIAWDAKVGRRVWETKERFPLWSGAVATAGDVVFYGTLDGWFKAADAKSGRPLWQFKVGSGVVAAPITFSGPDGKQYVAVYAGIGGDWALLSGDLRADDPTDVRDPADYIRDLGRYTTQGGMVWIFGL